MDSTMDDYDNIDISDIKTFPVVLSKNSTNDFTDQEKYVDDLKSTQQQQQEKANFYSSLTLPARPIIYTPVSNGTTKTTPRSYPKVIVSLCIVAGLVIPVLLPFVLYFLFQSRLEWSKGNYNSAYRRANQTANVTIAGVVVFVTLSLVTILIVGVIAFQQSSDSSDNFNTSYTTMQLEKSKQIFKFKLLNVTSPTVLTSSMKRSGISESDNKMISQSEQLFQTDRFDNAATNVAPDSYKPTTANQQTQKMKDAMVNFEVLKNNNWKYAKINDTHAYAYNAMTNENRTISLVGYKLPDQQK